MQKRVIDIIRDTQKAGKHCLSFEFFPPKSDEGLSKFYEVARQLKTARPSFVSVTYGAGGSTRERTLDMCSWLKEELKITVVPHLTCVASSKNDIKNIVGEFKKQDFLNIMSLRGDPPQETCQFTPVSDGFRHANELVSFLKMEFPEICLGVGGYPEKHPEASSFEEDLHFLKRKVEAGASFITTQLFFDNTLYYRFVEAAQKVGIGEAVPIIPGIMPILSYSQIKRFTHMCGASLPKKLVHKLEKAENDPEAMELIGIDWATKQIDYLFKENVPGIHLYILNRSRAALELSKRLQF